MAWVTPPTFVSGNVLTAAQLNILGGDINETAVAKATAAGQWFMSSGANALVARTPQFANIATSEGTVSTTFTDLTTPGPTVTVTTGTTALVFVCCEMSHITAGGFCQAGYNVSNATTIAADLGRCLSVRTPVSNHGVSCGLTIQQTGLNAGTNVFKEQYETSNGGGNLATFSNRRIAVIPL